METRIRVNSSSSDEVYTVVFRIEDNMISINCDCQAGLNKMLCKHRLNLLEGDISSINDKSQISALTDILSKIDKNRITNLYVDLNKVEFEIKKLDALRKKLKKEIGQKFSEGF